MSGPIRYPRGPLSPDGGLPPYRSINPPAGPAWGHPVLTEWELRSASFTDRHIHDEYVYVLEGECEVECDGVTVTAGVGDTVVVPGGSAGTYRTRGHVRLLSVYAPNPDGVAAENLDYSPLD